MKRIAALVVVTALSATSCAGARLRPTLPRDRSWHWANVVALPPGTLIRVTTTDRARHQGTFIDADAATLRIQTKHGASSFQTSLVGRVERFTAPPRSRVRGGLVGAALGPVPLVLVTALFCQAVGGRPCSPSRKSIAATAAIFGGMGVLSDGSRRMTVYEAPVAR